MELLSTHIGNAFLEAYTAKKASVIACPEFEDHERQKPTVNKALCRLRSSGARWHDKFADYVRELYFFPCKSEPEI
jgi:hypothetical protein